jgi:hypothetical protein
MPPCEPHDAVAHAVSEAVTLPRVMAAVTLVPFGPCDATVREKCVAVAVEPAVCGVLGPFGAQRSNTNVLASPAK